MAYREKQRFVSSWTDAIVREIIDLAAFSRIDVVDIVQETFGVEDRDEADMRSEVAIRELENARLIKVYENDKNRYTAR